MYAFYRQWTLEHGKYHVINTFSEYLFLGFPEDNDAPKYISLNKQTGNRGKQATLNIIQ